jgi:protein ImuB
LPEKEFLLVCSIEHLRHFAYSSLMQSAKEQSDGLSHIFNILHKWGIHTLGQLAALPKDELAARFGPIGVRLWEQADGKSNRLLRLVRPAEVFLEQCEFEHEVETAAPLLFVLHRFLEQLTQRLGTLYFLVSELTLQLTFADKKVYERRFQIPDPTNSVELLFRLLQTALENFRTEHPIVAVSLEAQPARPAKQQFRFFETPLRDPARLHETLNRLTALLGRERVGRPVREDSHRDDAFHLEPFVWELPESADEPPNEPMIGPALRRLRQQPISAAEKAVRTRQGPYLSSGDWWDEKSWQRREWDLELENGTMARAQKNGPHWRLEAIYD